MGEQELKELKRLMSMEEFKKYIKFPEDLSDIDLSRQVHRFKSVRRAIKRGHVSMFGTLNPKRPFNNRANTSKRKGVHSRSTNELKKQIYEQVKQYQRRVAQ